MNNSSFIGSCKDLVGYQLVSISDTQIVVRKDGDEHVLSIIEDYGDCCGYNEITANLLISETELGRNPVITKVEITSDDCGEGSSGKLTFFGEYKPMAALDTFSYSGSGWCYGANVSIYCKELQINDTLSAW